MARLGVFICWCGSNIAETVDSDAVAEYAGTLKDVVTSVSYKYTCSDPGQRMITDAIQEHKLTGVVVASCSPRMHENTFRKTAATVGMNPYMLEMANIREHCSWVHPDKKTGTEKAKALVRMKIEKVRRNHPLEDIKIPMTRRVMVVGAGIAGIQASLDVAKAGYEVVLVERKPSIGGHMAMLDETFPTLDCSQCILTPRMVEIMQSEKIHLHSFTEVEKVDGYVGNFEITLRKKDRGVDLDKCTGCGDCWNSCMAQHKIQIKEPEPIEGILPAQQEAEIDVMIEKLKGRKAMMIPLLLDIQKTYKHLPKPVLRYVSARTQVPLSRIYGVARFYHAFSLEPKGRHIIKVCMGTACHLKGAPRIADAITNELGIDHGETTKDMKFTFERVNCLGACALAPVVTVNDKYHAKMSASKVSEMLKACD
jgi:heterodisulfide reductase subunit A-like polyferredoxin